MTDMRTSMEDLPIDQMIRAGARNKDIVQWLHEVHGINVTSQAVSKYRARHGLERAKVRHHELIPWRVRAEHAALYMPKLLRLVSRLRAGDQTLTETQRRYAERFQQRCEDMNACVHYDPDAFTPFVLVERRSGIDTDIVENLEYARYARK